MTTERAPFQIRPACLSDASELARLSSELGYPASESERASRLQAAQRLPPSFHRGATNASGLLGWIVAELRLVLESGEIIEISGLVVDTNQRQKGIGRALLAGAEQWGKNRGITTAWVSSNITRTGSHHFYERTGFIRTKTQHQYCKLLGSS